MQLINFRIDHFKHILDSGQIELQPDVTCIVGKNESGKTAVLHALHRFNPAQSNIKFNSQSHYPAWLEKRHRRDRDLDAHTPITLLFRLDVDEIAFIEKRFGVGFIKSPDIKISRSYKNKFVWEKYVNEHVAVAHMIGDIDLKGEQKPTNFADVTKLIEKLGSVTQEDATETDALRLLGDQLKQACTDMLGEERNLDKSMWSIVYPKVPKFFYFDDYNQLPGSVNIRDLISKPHKDLSPAEQTARALLDLSGAEEDYLLNPDYETRKRELENIANSITHEVLQYWSTNPELRTDVDVTLKEEPIHNGQQKVFDELKLRLYDNRHLLSLPFEERSTGFRWFFSFLVAFSAYENDTSPIVILLDEPGLGLHARAQADFLRFIDERLSSKCQVVYTTHSPFMVQPGKLERVRLVQDGGRNDGSRVTADVLAHDRDTLFPLQAALGYDLAQHLFISPHNLIVEGTSDYTYIKLVSDHLIQNGRVGLDPKWSIIPVGGVDVIPSGLIPTLGALVSPPR